MVTVVPLTIFSCSSSGSIGHARSLFQLPLDWVIKSQPIDITKIILLQGHRYCALANGHHPGTDEAVCHGAGDCCAVYWEADNADRRLRGP